jgi:hypothetical protein
MKLVYFICFVLWSILIYKIGYIEKNNECQNEFELISNDALLRINIEKNKNKVINDICYMNENMCIEKIEDLEKDIITLYFLFLMKDKELDILLKDNICFKKEEI